MEPNQIDVTLAPPPCQETVFCEQLPVLDKDSSYDEVLDVAVACSFPASDPIAVSECCCHLALREAGTPDHGKAPAHQTQQEKRP